MKRKRKKFAIKKQKINKYKQIIEDELDLHGYTQNEAQCLVNDFLDNARKNKFKKIRIITGKGTHSNNGQGVLKELVKDILLAQNLNFQNAKINEGGEGAVDISIKYNN